MIDQLLSLLIIIVAIILGFWISKNNNKSKVSLVRTSQDIIRIATLLGTLALTLHIGLLLFDINEIITIQCFGLCAGGTAVLIVASFLFDMCIWSKLGIIFNFIAKECTILKLHTDIFNGWLMEARFIMFLSGLIISAGLIYKAVLLIKNKAYENT